MHSMILANFCALANFWSKNAINNTNMADFCGKSPFYLQCFPPLGDVHEIDTFTYGIPNKLDTNFQLV